MRVSTEEQLQRYQKVIAFCVLAILVLLCANVWMITRLDARCREPGPPGPPPEKWLLDDMVERSVHRAIRRRFVDPETLKQMQEAH